MKTDSMSSFSFFLLFVDVFLSLFSFTTEKIKFPNKNIVFHCIFLYGKCIFPSFMFCYLFTCEFRIKWKLRRSGRQRFFVFNKKKFFLTGKMMYLNSIPGAILSIKLKVIWIIQIIFCNLDTGAVFAFGKSFLTISGGFFAFVLKE